VATDQITSVDDVQNALRAAFTVSIRGGGSKSALQPGNGARSLDLGGLSGIIEYEPGEYTFTAYAGTPLATVAAALAEHAQYLPFDPPFVNRGATLGGTVAAGLSGSGRYRFGGVRDFLIGVRIVDGQGRHVRGGGKVVKNLPKLMVGSLGQFGILTEVSFKVFPRPAAYQTLQVAYPTLVAARAGLQQAMDSPFDLYALDLHVTQATDHVPHYALWVRLGGLPAVLPARMAQLRQLLGGDMVTDQDEAALWQDVREANWLPAQRTLVKVALTAAQIAPLEATLTAAGAQRHYAVGGNLAWIAWPGRLAALDQQLQQLQLAGLALIGESGESSSPLIGHRTGQRFAQRIKAALDPEQRLPSYF
jgi:glycolate oxidase FAD binding subunit